MFGKYVRHISDFFRGIRNVLARRRGASGCQARPRIDTPDPMADNSALKAPFHTAQGLALAAVAASAEARIQIIGNQVF